VRVAALRLTGRRRWVGVVAAVLVLVAACQRSGEPANQVVQSVPITSTTGQVRSPDLSTQGPTTTAVPVPTTTVRAAPPRVLLVGDSTLLAVSSYGTEVALSGFDAVVEVASCRTLGIPSCGREPVPPNTVETIKASSGSFDGVVIMAGYDEWWTSFSTSLGSVMDAARARGAKWILWLNYPQDVSYLLPDGRPASESFVRNNATLEDYTARPGFDELVVADWDTYSGRNVTWIASDGIHLEPAGAYGVADYISRWVAHLVGAACPQPLTAGGEIDSPCPNPDTLTTTADVQSLYLSATG